MAKMYARPVGRSILSPHHGGATRMGALLAMLAAALILQAAFGAAASSASGPTALCKTSQSPCGLINQYPKYTGLGASSEQVTINAAYALHCTESEVGLYTLGTAEPQSALFEWNLGGCTATFLKFPCAVETSSEGSASISHTENGDGVASFPELSATVTCETPEGFEWECTYSTSGMELELNGGEPGELVASEEPMSESGSGPNCGSGENARLSATYEFGEPLYAAPPKPQAVFEAEEYPATLVSGTSTHLFATWVTEHCSTSFTEAELDESAETLTVTPVYTECDAWSWIGGRQVYTNGCKYRFNLGSSGGDGTMDIVNCEGITYKASGCDFVIPAQTGIGPVTFADTGEGTSQQFEVSLSGAAYEFSQSGNTCKPATGTGSYTGTWKVSGRGGLGELQGVWID